MKQIIYTSVVLILFVFPSCRKNTVEINQDESSKYMPLEVGYTWTYQMDSIHYTGNGVKTDTFSYQLRHRISDQFIDNEGNSAFRVEIHFRDDTSDDWRFTRNYRLTKRRGSYIRTDFDKDEIILVLPIHDEKLWDGNLYNTDGKSDYYYLYSHQPFTVNLTQFDSSITVFQEERINIIESFRGMEIYALNTGLIYREKERLKDIHDPAKTSGYSYTLTFISFEK